MSRHAGGLAAAGYSCFIMPFGQTGEASVVRRGFMRTTPVDLEGTCMSLNLECVQVSTLGELVRLTTEEAPT